MSLRKLYYQLPPSLRLALRRVWYLPSDLLGRRGRLAPPKGLIYTGSGDFEAVGKKFLEYFREFAGLKADHDVLDIGSGIGRMAVPLTEFLSPHAHYEGFDVVQQGVRWCQKKITPRYPNFNFTYADIANDLYRSDGKHAEQFVFPYPDEKFDLVIVISVFTHMLRAEVGHYLSEINRCLKPGRRAFVTCFLLNEVSRKNMAAQDFRFDYPDDGCYLMDPKVRSANVAYDEIEFERMCANAELTVERVLYGKWSGRAEAVLDFQDMVILRKDS